MDVYVDSLKNIDYNGLLFVPNLMLFIRELRSLEEWNKSLHVLTVKVEIQGACHLKIVNFSLARQQRLIDFWITTASVLTLIYAHNIKLTNIDFYW